MARMKIFIFMCAAVMACVFTGCRAVNKEVQPGNYGCAIKGYYCQNRQAIEGLSPGMSKEEVLAALGEERLKTESLVITNPYRSQTAKNQEVIYFYTGSDDPEGEVSEKDLIPLFFEHGVLVGIGYCELD